MPDTPLRSARRGIRGALAAVDHWGGALGDWPGDAWAARVVAVQAAVWTLLAGPVLLRHGHFTYDQAYFYEMAVRTAEALRIPGYGPFVSGVRGDPLTPGGLLYGVLAVPFLVFRHPGWGHAWLLLLSFLGVLLLDRALRRLSVPPAVRIGTLVLLTWSLAHARASETFWNADLFTFTTPALLWTATRLRDAPAAGLGWAVLLGLLSALAVQTHLSGGMAVALALVLLALEPGALSWARAATALGVFALAYLPFLVVDGRSGFVDWQLLRAAARPVSGLQPDVVMRSLLSPVVYASHLELAGQLAAPATGWGPMLIKASGAVAVLLAALGVVTRLPGKLLVMLTLLGLPVFFLLTGRAYLDHYVLAVVPFCCLLAGAGIGRLLACPGPQRWAAMAYLAAFVVAGGVLLVTRAERPGLGTWNPWRGMTVAWQLQKAEEALARAPAWSGPGDELAFVRSVLARRVLGHELTFAVRGVGICTADLRLSGLQPPVWQTTGAPVLPLAANSVLVCPRPAGAGP